MEEEYCDKEMDIEAYVSNGWHETCKVRCGWFDGRGGKYQCNNCKSKIKTKL